MNKLSINKISYTVAGFSSDNTEQLNTIENLVLKTQLPESYNSIALLNITNENKTDQYNSLYYIDENGVGFPINTAVIVPTADQSNNDNTPKKVGKEISSLSKYPCILFYERGNQIINIFNHDNKTNNVIPPNRNYINTNNTNI